MDFVAVTEFTREAQHQLRDPSNFSWTTVTLIAFVSYVYSVEIRARTTRRSSPG